MMPIYRVVYHISTISTCDVEADSSDDAVEKANYGEWDNSDEEVDFHEVYMIKQDEEAIT